MKMARKPVYKTLFDAQIALANKRNQQAWAIAQTENGWFVLVPRKA